ncbi:uncharacterized protein N7443_010685 [Penicillium atrosanguineum]|uniref:Ribonuclease H2 subunit B n=1 Tax=Penicillium atrosanguineum TaxID=1132637 RepID=A0A9W9U2J0_9EURO|nr:uncharacterized protein N7443_010685 [Penicillium atrosanguineum]KAJ5141346.1 hypothetical protein N7526_002341 [Penicillium atrosanguineum]KAJ5290432.1 hypothetical protein N7443_010685 [Penicillium atrosanguineum]KAJ5308254.1 hypothetical protein N7476_008910 [Penicillium atrosanguineum]
MPRTTRATAPKEEPKSEDKKTLVAAKPSKTFILPSPTSAHARLLSLPNPQSGELSRYFFCPERGIYEFTVVASPPTAARSILYTPKSQEPNIALEDEKEKDVPSVTASVAKKAELLIATPIDTLFFLAHLFSISTKSGQSLFQPLDDIIDSNDDLHPHFRHVLYDETFRSTLLARAEAICETVEAGDEKMLRFSEMKLLKELIAKAERMAVQGLPASLEERFIRQALAAPLMAVKREESLAGQAPKDEEASSRSEVRQDSPSTVATTSTPSVSTPAGESTPAPGEDSDSTDNVRRLQRIVTVLSFMKESYLSQSLCSRIDEILASPETPLDLKPLHDRLKQLVELRTEAFASRNMSDFSRKRGLDDEEMESRADKKRKKEEEEKVKKAAESQAVRNLKKVNTTGMKKMSDFFGKAAAKKKT